MICSFSLSPTATTPAVRRFPDTTNVFSEPDDSSPVAESGGAGDVPPLTAEHTSATATLRSTMIAPL